MRLLVVDDEKVVQNSIRLIIKKENLKFVEMDTASTGKEAIEKAISFRPDVIFMDINMPGLNGIDAMKSISRLHPTVLFVIVSAYDVFEYAKESLRAGAYDYIVKPFVPARIVETLLSLNEKLESRTAEREDILHLKEKVSELSSFAADGIISLMIYGDNIGSYTAKYSNIMPKNGGRIAILRISSDSIKRAETTLLDLKRHHPELIAGSMILDRILIFIPFGLDLGIIDRKLENNLGKNDYTLACGSEEDIENMYSSYRSALSLLASNTGKVGMIVSDDETERTDNKAMYLQLAACEPHMLAYETEALMLNVMHPDSFEKTVSSMSAALLAAAHTILSGDDLSVNLNGIVETAFYNILSSKTEHDLVRESTAFLSQIRECAAAKSDNKHIRAALDYIDANYKEDISLESTSKHINVAPGSLSRLFRTHLKKSFTEILMEKRIAKACSMIKDDQYSIKEICYMVGYNDPNYFSRIFKKTTGLSPSDYREYGV
ncbi:MAG: response regulator [Christensenellaceae bacterium]|nr:response regulator [Christensenellaceae bacterium]